MKKIFLSILIVLWAFLISWAGPQITGGGGGGGTPGTVTGTKYKIPYFSDTDTIGDSTLGYNGTYYTLLDKPILFTGSDVAHGMTSYAVLTTAYGYWGPISGTNGGFSLVGLSDDNAANGLLLEGVVGGTTPSVAATIFSAKKKNGASAQNLAATEIAFEWYNGSTLLAQMLGNGTFTLVGNLGATGNRVPYGYFADLVVTNAIQGSVTGAAGNLIFTSDAEDDIPVRGATVYGRVAISAQQVVGRITGGHVKGLSTAEMKTLLGYPTAASDYHIDDILTALGIASEATHFGTFTGSTIADNVTAKAALQALETAVEGKQATLTRPVTGPASPTASKPMCWDSSGQVAKDCANLTDSPVTADNYTDNTVGVPMKGNNGQIYKGTLDAHLSATGTTSPALAVVTPSVDGGAGSTTLTAAQMGGNGVIVTNYSQSTSDARVTLPAAAAGLSALFTVVTAQSQHFGALAGAGDKFYLVAADGTISSGDDAAAVVMTAAQLGQSFAVWSQQTGASTWDWFCKAIAIGTSTFALHAAF